MNEEIEIGDYIRTKNGNFGKVIDVSNETNQTQLKYLIKWSIGKAYYVTKRTIVKHSKNIIDLIEAGDYVNGERVSNSDKYDNIYTIEWDCGNVYTTEIINDKFIRSIVTKEMFSSVEYRVENN